MIKGKEKLKNQYLIDFLSTKALIQKNKIKGSIISINEISYRVFALYWQIEINKNNSEIGHSILNDIQYNLISKYGLSRDSNVDEIEQVLNYIDDKSVQIKLYGIIKFSLTCLSNPYNSTKFVNYIINKLKGIDIEKKEILQINKNISIKIDSDWSNYFKNNDTFIKEIENKIIELEEGNFVDELEPKLETKDNKEDFNRLFELEKKMKFYMKIDKEKYACLEEAFAWMDMNIENYKKIHNTYITYTKENSFKKIKLELPLVTSAMLIYTAIYRYNDEDASGFWPEFFGNKDGYNYVYDVLPTMECISYVIEEYGIYGDKRKYLQKKNLAEIFSQIYLPEVSLVKILSAIYKAYFRGNTFNRLVNKIDFIEKNDYILDKPGSFFISEDNIIEDVFYDLVDLVRDGIKGIESNNERLPKRFYISFEKWLKEDKKEMDKYKEDYYIANPRIIIDTINEEIKIYLPKQKSRGYSDETISWNLTIDDIKKTIEGRVIRQRDGAYLILEEKLKIKKFKKILIEFIFNDEKLGTWEFTNDKKYMIFDKHRTLLNKDNVNRDGCFIAIPKDFKLEINEVFNRYEILGWKDYMFYYLELAEYQGERLIINKEIDIPIEEQPVVDSKDFELLFENPNYKSINESVNIYKKFGSYEIISPFINKDCIHIIFDEIEEKKSKVDFIEINQTSKNKVELNIDQELLSGVYSIFIKYKNKSIYRESFIVDKFSKVKQEYILSYNNEENGKATLF